MESSIVIGWISSVHAPTRYNRLSYVFLCQLNFCAVNRSGDSREHFNIHVLIRKASFFRRFMFRHHPETNYRDVERETHLDRETSKRVSSPRNDFLKVARFT